MAACVVLTRPVPASLVSPLPPYFPCKVPPSPSQVPPPSPLFPLLRQCNQRSCSSSPPQASEPTTSQVRLRQIFSLSLPIFANSVQTVPFFGCLVEYVKYVQTSDQIQIFSIHYGSGAVEQIGCENECDFPTSGRGTSSWIFCCTSCAKSRPHARSRPSSHGNSNNPIQWTNLLFGG